MTCTQNYIVYDRVGEPVKGEWAVHAKIYEKDTDVFIEEKTCNVDSNGVCSIELDENTWIMSDATKDEERSTGMSCAACYMNTIDLWQLLDCYQPTPYHESGREMLIYWDADKDGILSKDEVTIALLEYLFDSGTISVNEVYLIIECYYAYYGTIDYICPPQSWWDKYGKAIFAGTFVLGLGAIAKVSIDSITKRIRK